MRMLYRSAGFTGIARMLTSTCAASAHASSARAQQAHARPPPAILQDAVSSHATRLAPGQLLGDGLGDHLHLLARLAQRVAPRLRRGASAPAVRSSTALRRAARATRLVGADVGQHDGLVAGLVHAELLRHVIAREDLRAEPLHREAARARRRAACSAARLDFAARAQPRLKAAAVRLRLRALAQRDGLVQVGALLLRRAQLVAELACARAGRRSRPCLFTCRAVTSPPTLARLGRARTPRAHRRRRSPSAPRPPCAPGAPWRHTARASPRWTARRKPSAPR